MARLFVLTFFYVSTIFFLLFSVFKCDPLTKQENDNRLATCGTNGAVKVWQGRVAEQSEAPWAVFMVNGLEVCTGTVVSSRHILIATHCFFDQTPNGWLDAQGFDRKNCKGDHYVTEDSNFLNGIRLESNKVTVARSPERVTLVNACVPRTVPPGTKAQNLYDDFAIIDLYEELPFSPTLQMACVPRDTSNNGPGVQMEFFGFGLDPSVSATDTGILRHEIVKVVQHTSITTDNWFLTKNPDGNRIACSGDSGGGMVQRLNGKITVMGALSQTSCKKGVRTGPNAVELHSAVGFYSKNICQMTGICEASEYDTYHSGYVRPPKPARNLPADPTGPQGQQGQQGQQRGLPSSEQNVGDGGDNVDIVDSAHSTHFNALVLTLTLVFLMIG